MILPVLLASLAVAPKRVATIALPPGYYGFDAIARALSTPEAPIAAAKSLRRRAIYLDLKPSESARFLKILQAASDVVLTREATGGRLRLEPDDAVLRREAKDREAVVARLRSDAERVAQGAEVLRREGQSPEDALQRADLALKASRDGRGGLNAAAADALAGGETDLWAALALPDLDKAEGRLATRLLLGRLSGMTGDAFANPAMPDVWNRAGVEREFAAAREPVAEREAIAARDGIQTYWKLQRDSRGFQLHGHYQWLSTSVNDAPGTLSVAGFLPGDAQRDARTGVVEALYVGIPGSRRWGPVLGPESQARYAALDREGRTFLATEEGRSLKTAFVADASERRPFSNRFRLWAREAKREVAFELTPIGDVREPWAEAATIPGTTTWRISPVEGVLVANDLLDFADRVIPVDTLALVPLLTGELRPEHPFTESEVRDYYRATGPRPFLPSGIPSDYYGRSTVWLGRGGAAFLAYEAVRSRPEVRALLAQSGGARKSIAIPLAKLGPPTFEAIAEALIRSPYNTARLYPQAMEALRRASVAVQLLSPAAESEERSLYVWIQRDRASMAQSGTYWGLDSAIVFLPR